MFKTLKPRKNVEPLFSNFKGNGHKRLMKSTQIVEDFFFDNNIMTMF